MLKSSTAQKPGTTQVDNHVQSPKKINWLKVTDAELIEMLKACGRVIRASQPSQTHRRKLKKRMLEFYWKKHRSE